MSEQTHLDDERLSALFDGLGPADDEAHVAACADCAARLALWRHAMHLIANPPVPSEETRQAAIAAALEAPEQAAGVSSLSARQRQLAARLLTTGRLGAAAAVLVVTALIGVVAVNATHGSHNSNSSASASRNSAAAPTTSEANSGPSAGVSSAGGVPFGVGSNTPTAVPSKSTIPVIMQAGLGSFDSTSTLVPVVQARLRHPVGATVPSAELNRCSQVAADRVADPTQAATMEAPLTYRDSDALAYVFSERGRYSLEVLAPLTCRMVASANF